MPFVDEIRHALGQFKKSLLIFSILKSLPIVRVGIFNKIKSRCRNVIVKTQKSLNLLIARMSAIIENQIYWAHVCNKGIPKLGIRLITYANFNVIVFKHF